MEHGRSLTRAGTAPPGGRPELGALRRSELAAPAGAPTGMTAERNPGMLRAGGGDPDPDLLQHLGLIRERLGVIQAQEDQLRALWHDHDGKSIGSILVSRSVRLSRLHALCRDAITTPSGPSKPFAGPFTETGETFPKRAGALRGRAGQGLTR